MEEEKKKKILGMKTEKKKSEMRTSKSTGSLGKETEPRIPASKSTGSLVKLQQKKREKKREKESEKKTSSPAGIPALPKNPKETVEAYERDLVCCKLQIALSLIKQQHLENKLKNKKVRSSSRFIDDSSKIEEELVVCKQYIKTKQAEFLRLRPLWRKAKRLLLRVDEDPATYDCAPTYVVSP